MFKIKIKNKKETIPYLGWKMLTSDRSGEFSIMRYDPRENIYYRSKVNSPEMEERHKYSMEDIKRNLNERLWIKKEDYEKEIQERSIRGLRPLTRRAVPRRIVTGQQTNGHVGLRRPVQLIELNKRP